MKIIKNKLDNNLKKIIYDGFEEYSIEKIGESGIEDPISFYIEDSFGNIISAVVCNVFHGSLHIKYVWTHKDHRNKGYAINLMKEAFDFAIEREFPFAFVETMNYQAPAFYQKLGFEIEFIREGYSHSSSFYYMRKDF